MSETRIWKTAAARFVLGALVLGVAPAVHAQGAYETLYGFESPPSNPFAALLEASDGAFYGTTYSGGARGFGTIFRYDRSTSTLSTIHSFNLANGAFPNGTLIEAADGALYGTTVNGGASGVGTVFRYDLSTSTLSTLHSFDGTSGENPHAGLLQGSDGALYGTTGEGGASDKGTLFRYDLSTSTFATLHSFNGANGANPHAALIQGSNGSLYGTTRNGGASGLAGTVFRYDLSSSTLTTLHSFNGTTGAYPYSALIHGLDGALYGTTSSGGPGDYGTVFRYDLSTSTLTTLQGFVINGTNGSEPYAALIQGADGALYGTTNWGGTTGVGTVFRYDLSTSTLTTLQSFNGTNGAHPIAAVIQGSDGALYGTTVYGGGVNGFLGTVFRYDLSTSTFNTLHSFNGTHGAMPFAAVTQGSDGALYGTTSSGGASGAGTAFRYDLSLSTLTTLHAFNGANGADPRAAVMQTADGALHGTTNLGGASNLGTIFRYDLSTSTLTTLHGFNDTNGANPGAALLQGSDGALYGTTAFGGGASGAGTLFRYELSASSFTTLHSFDIANGAVPYAALIEGSDGALYGTTYQGGATDLGTVFRYDLSTSTLTTLHTFDGPTGANPYAALIEGSDGSLYGTTYHGGAADLGTVFRYDLSTSTLTTLHSFDGPNGANPYAAVIQGSDGAVYGTTSIGGASNYGTVFRYDLSTSTITTLHSFDGTSGSEPYAGLVQGSDGALYGTTATGGPNGGGVIFRIPLGPPPADLSITKTDGQTTAVPGLPISYTIVATNLGPGPVAGATVTDVLPAALLGATWTCAGTGGGSCTPSGTGNIDDSAVDLPVGATVTYTLNAIVDPGATGTLTNTVSVATPAGITDPEMGNNSATDTDTLGEQSPIEVTVVAPNGGETVYTGSAYRIEWTTSDDISSFDVAASSDGGVTFNPIPECTGLSGSARSCLWAAPGPETAQARIRVTAHDSSSNSASDVSDANFRIRAGTASITVTRPNTPLSWRLGTIKRIRWHHNLRAGSTVAIELSRDAGATWNVIAASVVNVSGGHGAYDWLVTGPATTTALVRVSWPSNPAVSDISDVPFTIAAPFITVTAPNTAVRWKIGTIHRLRWSHNLGTSESVNIELSRDGGGTWTPIVSGLANSANASGIYDWTVTGPTTSQARIRVSWASDTSVSDISDANFAIRPIPGAPPAPSTEDLARFVQLVSQRLAEGTCFGQIVVGNPNNPIGTGAEACYTNGCPGVSGGNGCRLSFSVDNVTADPIPGSPRLTVTTQLDVSANMPVHFRVIGIGGSCTLGLMAANSTIQATVAYTYVEETGKFRVAVEQVAPLDANPAFSSCGIVFSSVPEFAATLTDTLRGVVTLNYPWALDVEF